MRHDPGTRLGRDPEELHQMRVATRRMRAILRAAAPLLDPEWVRSLRAEVGWLGGALGPVRDLDVLVAHLRADAHRLGEGDERAFLVLLRSLSAEHDADRAAMLEVLRRSPLREADRAARARDRGPAAEHRDRGRCARWQPASSGGCDKRVRALGDDPPDAELHATRIAVKRARYAAELAERSMGKPAVAVIRDLKLLQDVLGRPPGCRRRRGAHPGAGQAADERRHRGRGRPRDRAPARAPARRPRRVPRRRGGQVERDADGVFL